MEAIFNLYDKTKDPDYIGHDAVAKDIFELSSKSRR